MIPSGVEIFVGLTPIDLRCYAEFDVMRSRIASSAISPSWTLRAGLIRSA